MIITLLSDFGTTDHYVAAMKGAILSRDPRIRIVDVSHEVPSHDIATAGFLLHSAYRDFPGGTVHLAVVDPGVGSARRPIAIQVGDYSFVGPDNGIFDLIRSHEAGEARLIDSPELRRAAPSRTFHGRDIFAPTAAALAAGFPFDRVGPVVELGKPLYSDEPPDASGTIQGRILHVDHFGNAVTSLTAADLTGGPVAYRFAGSDWTVDEVRDFYSAGKGIGPFVIEGSSGYFEISVNRGSAAALLSLRRGDYVDAIPRSRADARQAGD